MSRLRSAAIVFLLTAGPAGGSPDADPGGGTTSLLVKSRVPISSEVLASIGAHARVVHVWPEIDAVAVSVNPEKIAELTADPVVAFVEADQIGQVPGPDTDGDLSVADPAVTVPLEETPTPMTTWNLDMAGTPGSGFSGTGVTVAVVDSGLPQNWEEFLPPGSVDIEHAVGFGAEGLGDYHNPVNAIRGAGGHIGLSPHGLAVASVIVGFRSEWGPIGGAAPGAKILPIQVLNRFNWGWYSWFTAGILHVARLKESGALPGPVVINFSIEGRTDSAILTSAIDYAIGRGVLFVTVAGDFGPDPETISYPGRLPQSITTGAVGWTKEGCVPPACSSPWFFADVPENDPSQVYVATSSGREASSSAVPAGVDIVAPGSFVLAEWLFGPGFSEGREVAFDAARNFVSGTAFAAPHIAGIVAQMLESNPDLTQSDVEFILRTSALPLTADPDGLETGFQVVAPWGSSATGSGLARGAVAVASTWIASLQGGPVDCFNLEYAYQDWLYLARSCDASNPVPQCTLQVQDQLACGCPTFVNPTTDAAAMLVIMQYVWDLWGCSIWFACEAQSC